VSFSIQRAPWTAVLLLAGLGGCKDEDAATHDVETPPFSGQQIQIAVPARASFRETWEAPLNEWVAQTGASYELLESVDSSEPFEAASDGERPSLAVFPLAHAGELASSGNLAPIPESLLRTNQDGLQWHDLFAGLREKLASQKGRGIFLPLSCPVLVCYYRDDLLQAAGLNPPQTWDDHQRLLDSLAEWAPGLTAVEPWSEDFRATMFFARAVSFAQHPGHYSLFFDIETGEPLIDRPGFVQGLKTALSALAKMPPDVLTYDPADCRNEILSGRAALAITFEVPGSGNPELVDANETRAAERAEHAAIGFARLAGSREIYNGTRHVWEPSADKGISRVTLTGFAGRAAGASTQNSPRETEAAWNALVKVSGADCVSGFPPGIIGLCRESQLRDPAAIVGPGLDDLEATRYAEAVAESLRDLHLVAELPVIGRDEFRHALTAALTSALDGSQTAEEALKSAAAAWREIADKIGTAKIRGNYRASLGLSPVSKSAK